MSQSTTTEESEQTTADSAGFSRDETFEVLSNRRRRFAMHFLKQREGTEVTVSELADKVAAWENGKETDQLTHRERKRVRNALRQFHLPKMDDYGFVAYDARRGTVELTDPAAEANFYLDSLTGGDIPWGVYYLALSAVGVFCLLGVWVGTYPFSLVSPLSYAVFLVGALTVSALGHLYDNYVRMRMGAQDRPPEVEDG